MRTFGNEIYAYYGVRKKRKKRAWRMDEAAVGNGSDRWRWMKKGNGSVRFVRI